MRVKWTEDLRPLPDVDIWYSNEAAFDTSLILHKEGEVLGTSRTFFGTWMHLVELDDGTRREVPADECTRVPEDHVNKVMFSIPKTKN